MKTFLTLLLFILTLSSCTRQQVLAPVPKEPANVSLAEPVSMGLAIVHMSDTLPAELHQYYGSLQPVSFIEAKLSVANFSSHTFEYYACLCGTEALLFKASEPGFFITGGEMCFSNARYEVTLSPGQKKEYMLRMVAIKTLDRGQSIKIGLVQNSEVVLWSNAVKIPLEI